MPDDENSRRSPRQFTVIATLHTGRALAFIAVTVAFVLALFIAQRASDRAAEVARQGLATAQQAQAAAAVSKANSKELTALRNEQVNTLHGYALVSCESRHKLATVLHDAVLRGITEARALETSKTGSLPGVHAAEEQSIRSSERLLRDLRGADCTHLPPLPRTKP